jgi:hypothetical protein
MKTIDARGFLLRRDSAALPFDRHRSDLTSGLKRRIGEKVLAYLAQTSTHAFNRKREAAFARRQCSCVHGPGFGGPVPDSAKSWAFPGFQCDRTARRRVITSCPRFHLA